MSAYIEYQNDATKMECYSETNDLHHRVVAKWSAEKSAPSTEVQ